MTTARREQIEGTGETGMSARQRLKVTTEEYAQWLSEQSHQCAICGKREQLHVDHDHTTNAVRALLCNGCNSGLACFRDNPVSLREAITYLEYHRENPKPPRPTVLPRALHVQQYWTPERRAQLAEKMRIDNPRRRTATHLQVRPSRAHMKRVGRFEWRDSRTTMGAMVESPSGPNQGALDIGGDRGRVDVSSMPEGAHADE
jgi:hypothetical protein